MQFIYLNVRRMSVVGIMKIPYFGKYKYIMTLYK